MVLLMLNVAFLRPSIFFFFHCKTRSHVRSCRSILSFLHSLSHSLVVVLLRWFERTHTDTQRFSGDAERDERRKWQRESFCSGGISLAQVVRFLFGSFEWTDDQIYRHECRNTAELPHSPEEKRYFPFSPFLFLRMSLDAWSRSRGMLITSLVHNSTARRCSSSSAPSIQQRSSHTHIHHSLIYWRCLRSSKIVSTSKSLVPIYSMMCVCRSPWLTDRQYGEEVNRCLY